MLGYMEGWRWFREGQTNKWEDLEMCSFEDFVRELETRIKHWSTCYEHLLRVATPAGPNTNAGLSSRVQEFKASIAGRKDWGTEGSSMEDGDVGYQTGWLISFYGEHMCEVVGGMEFMKFMNPESLPLGLISMMKRLESSSISSDRIKMANV